MARSKSDGRGRLGGRAKGTPNKLTTLSRDLINNLTVETYDSFKARMLAIQDDKQFCDVWLKLLKFSVPELSAVDIKASDKKKDLRDELDEIYKEAEK